MPLLLLATYRGEELDRRHPLAALIPRLARDATSERLDLHRVIASIQRRGQRARILADADSIVDITAPEMRPGDVVVILSNGGFGGIYEKLPQRLKELAGSANRTQESASNA